MLKSFSQMNRGLVQGYDNSIYELSQQAKLQQPIRF